MNKLPATHSSLNALSSPRSSEQLEIERLNNIQGIIEMLYKELGRPLPTPKTLSTMAASWDVHFTKAKIPTDKLLAAYYDAFAEWDGKGFFSHASIIHTWHNRQVDPIYSEILCPICKGTKKVKIYDLLTKTETEQDCRCTASERK